ncbi:MAG: UDP-N-acetylmuramoyl-tripeptide--D-alanyl-D-alanine ligase [Gammaproteobacteria bacterium]|nr:UDP-N-acetylmuramoyl-tripeptide--D-alanyl-D-alanine ligase [Gammaproteobacteria bacterium]
MQLAKIASALTAELIGSDVEFNGVSIDSRSVQPGELFIALKGPNFDGHDYIVDAKKRGAVAVIVSDAVTTDLPLLKVINTRDALFELARYHRGKLKLPIIAVTGSCGKTTTRALLAQVFSQAGKVLASEGSFNNDIGVPLTLLKITSEHDYAIIEMGANHSGEIAKLTHLVKPTVAIVTNVGPAHLEGFGSLDGVACAKAEIFQGLSTKGTAIINNDDAYASFWRNTLTENKVLCFAVHNAANVRAKNIRLTTKMTAIFDLVLAKQQIEIKLKVLGAHNVYNALAAATAATVFKIPIEKIKRGLEKALAVNRRLMEYAGLKGATIIDDSYNANPTSVAAAIHLIGARKGVPTLVLADMGELGDAAERLHAEIGELAKQAGIKQLYCYGQLTQHAVAAYGENAHYFKDRAALIDTLRDNITSDMVILIKGSNAMGMEQVVSALKEN